MDPTCGLADKFRDLVLDQIWEQLLYLIYYHKNTEQLNQGLQELTNKRSATQHRIDEARNNVYEIEQEVLGWLDEVNEISEQAQLFHEEARQAEIECSITSCPNPWLRYKLSKKAKAMAQQVAAIYEKAKFERVAYRLPPSSMPELTNGESNDWINSRVPILNQIMEALRNPSVNMIGLCGLGGVGKTTIAKEIAQNQKMFKNAIMAIVSNKVDIENIQSQIAEALGMQLNEEIKTSRAWYLRQRLKEEKNLLLVLDDLWAELDLHEVGIPFLDVENNSKKNEGCKILLTSRNKTLLSDNMKCQKIIEVSILSHDEALNLFKRIAELSVDSSSPELISIATDIVQKCGGLPLLITTLAKALRYKDLNEWKSALTRLNHPLGRNITGIKDADNILRWSYDRLSSSENKHIFLLASMLSHDPSIKDLLMYSLGLDFLKHTGNIEDTHVGLSAIVSKLKSSNLFLDSFSSHHVTMHDVIRDVALSIASNELHAFIVRHEKLNEWPDEHELQDIKGICLQESDISVDLPEELYGRRLKFFMLNSTQLHLTIPKMFFRWSKELKVLAFTKVHFSSLPSLKYLKKLKTFCLHSCLLEDITEIRTLKNLKVLSLAYSKIQWLPIELAELTNLQMLNLSHCSDLKVIPQKLLSSLKKLEALFMENSFNQWKVEGSSEGNENASLDELKDLPISSLDIHIRSVSMLPENLFLHMNLKRYRILIGKCWVWWKLNHENSKILRLELEKDIHLKSGVQKLLEGIEDFGLSRSNGLDNIHFRSFFSKVIPNLEELELQGEQAMINHLISMYQFPKVKMFSLFLDDASTISYKSLCKSFPNLEQLQLEGDFEEALETDDVAASFSTLTLNNISNKRSLSPSLVSSQNLTHLKVTSYQLTTLMTSSTAQCLVHLTRLTIDGCYEMEEIITKQERENDEDKEIIFRKLKVLEFENMPELKRFCGYNYTLRFPLLEQIVMKRCPKFKIFSPGNIDTPSLVSFQLSKDWGEKPHEIWDTNLDRTFYQQRFVASREVVLDECDASMMRNGRFPVESCPHVEILGVQGFIDDEWITLLEIFPGMKVLHVKDCSFEEIFPSHAPSLASFHNLTELKVSKCHQLIHLVTNSTAKSLVNLETLEISDCEKMKEIVMKESSEDVERGGIMFNGLKILKLESLPILKTEDFNIEDKAIGVGLRLLFHHNQVLLPKLEILELSNLVNNLISLIWKEQLLHNSFSNLKTLIVQSCGSLKWVPLHVLKSLNNLEKLQVSKCDKLEMVFDFEDLNDCKDMESASVVVPLNLTNLEVKSCQGLTTLMMSSAARSLAHLTHLSIEYCDKMKEIITKQEGEDEEDMEIVFSKLEILELLYLTRLKRFCSHNYSFSFPLLEVVTIRVSSTHNVLFRSHPCPIA